MLKRVLTFLALWACIAMPQMLSAQYISAQKGLGVRGSFWRSENNLGNVRVGAGVNPNVKLNISGVGGSIYFFNIWSSRLFFETTFGAAGSFEVQASSAAGDNVDFSALVPLLFGLRYELLTPANTANLRPYLGAGFGPYWLATGTSGYTSDGLLGQEQVDVSSEFKIGTYVGTGVNLHLFKWFAFNFDFKYHFVDFKNLETFKFTGLEFGLGLSAMWGRQNELFVVRDTKIIVPDLYPAYYQFYSTYPIALVSVRNVAGFPIEVSVRSHIKGYSESVHTSNYVKLKNKQTKDIPVTVILGKKFLQVTEREPAVLQIEVLARTGKKYHKTLSEQIVVHNRNAWNGEVDKLSFFVTPDDEEILEMTRQVARDLPDSTNPGLRNLELASSLFDWMGGQRIRYTNDPNIPYYQDDRVQFALETLDNQAGDCDDLVVLFCSLLESAGINTAFVDVHNPDDEVAHLYMMFDTGLAPQDAGLISANDKKYVIRESLAGKSSVWVPVETTLLANGFEKAWRAGALQYLEAGILAGGLADGWVRIVELQ